MANDTCSIDGCPKRVKARCWCSMHYARWHVHGDPNYVAATNPRPQNRPRYFGCKADGCDGKHHGKGYCKRHYAQHWHRENIDHARQYQAEYRKQHREIANERSRQWREANPEWHRANYARWYRENADRVLDYRRRYREANREQIREHNRKRRMRERGATATDFAPEDWERIKAAFGHRCAYCGDRPDTLTRDHVIPLSKGGAHVPSNVVPACVPCNASKGAGPAPPMVVTPTF